MAEAQISSLGLGVYESHRVLEKPVLLKGIVVRGFGRGGKTLGCPTANLSTESLGLALDVVEEGIYYGWAQVMNIRPCKMVMSIGW
jgi:riboflavin kinase